MAIKGANYKTHMRVNESERLLKSSLGNSLIGDLYE